MPQVSTAPPEVKLDNRFLVKCNGSQISILGINYEQNAKLYLPLLEPARGRQPVIQAKSDEWWKAQCIFRGLDFSGSDTKAFQARLRAAPNTEMTADIRALETKTVRNFWERKQKAAVEAEKERVRTFNAQWLVMSHEEKAKINGGRMISESFPSSEKKSKPIIFRFKTYHTEVAGLALEADLAYKCEKFPEGHPEKRETYDSIGLKGPSTTDSIAIIARSTSDINKSKEWLAVKKSFQRAQAERLRKLAGNGKEWDVTGKYRICCPTIESSWNVDTSSFTLEIFAVKNQLCAKFDFDTIAGVFRFEKQPEKGIKGKSASSKPQVGNMSRKRMYDSDRDEDGYGGMEERYGDSDYDKERDNEEVQDGYEDEFQLGAISQPSEKYRNWTFRWRGEESGNGEISWEPIQVGTDSRSYKSKFCEPRGTKIEGTIGGGFLGDECTFTGEKISAGTGGKINPSFEWFKRSKWPRENTRGRRGRW
ncbi:hypothetical protein HYALB_00002585 [Hymenoscyphus albidus]|uniref:Uncharacterized protein n=1 Tax=Hymenoscyphus albidus TaxID=595503 RepID=A0A9N9LY47_9HELO|nr:hypothetical protein HYALB_00002585 [Hymenoscyphus albidus]